MYNLFRKAGFECVNYDLRNGQQFDLVDNSVWDPLWAAVVAREYAAGFACPDCASFSKLHNLPGPPPLRDAEGRGRYGRGGLTLAQAKTVREQTLIATRIAKLLTALTHQKVPWAFEAPWATAKMVSILNLDEFMALMALTGVRLVKGTQCPFGAESSKPTAWVFFIIDLSDMPNGCIHVKQRWFNQETGAAVSQRHKPTAGKVQFALLPPSRPRVAVRAFTPTEWVSSSLAAYPPLLNRFLVARIAKSVYHCISERWFRRPWPYDQTGAVLTSMPKLKYSHGFSEKIVWLDPLRGRLQPTDKEAADALAIGGLRDAAASLEKLTYSASFGTNLGFALISLVEQQHVEHPTASWIDATVACIGAEKSLKMKPPVDAIAAVKRLISEAVGFDQHAKQPAPLTSVDAAFLMAWARAAGDPDLIVCRWLIYGAPAGIEFALEDP